MKGIKVKRLVIVIIIIVLLRLTMSGGEGVCCDDV